MAFFAKYYGDDGLSCYLDRKGDELYIDWEGDPLSPYSSEWESLWHDPPI